MGLGFGVRAGVRRRLRVIRVRVRVRLGLGLEPHVGPPAVLAVGGVVRTRPWRCMPWDA